MKLCIKLRGQCAGGKRPTAEDILTADLHLYEDELKRAIVLYDSNGNKEIHLPKVLAEKIEHDFQGYNVDVRLTDEMCQRKFHPEYRVSHIIEANKLLENTLGLSASKEFLDLLEELLDSLRNVVVWKYEKLPLTASEVVKPLDVLSACVRDIPSFIARTYFVSDNVKLLPNLSKVGTNCYILPGNDFVILYRAKYDIVTNLMRIPIAVFTEYFEAIDDLQFTSNRSNRDALNSNIWHRYEYRRESLRTLCQQYSGDDFIIKLYETDEETVYCYKMQETYGRVIRFEVVNYHDRSNDNSCTLPWNVYTAIHDAIC